MLPLTAMALFCEDIREEKGDIATLIGILPDAVQFQDPTGGVIDRENPLRFISKLCVYVRVNFDPAANIGAPQIWLVMPDGNRLALGTIGEDIIDKSRSEATAKGNILAGVVSRITIAGFHPPDGPIKLEVDIKGETLLAGALLFIPPSANAPQQPS